MLVQCVLVDKILFALVAARGARADVCVVRVLGVVVFVAVAAGEVGGGGRAGSGIAGRGWSGDRSVGGGGSFLVAIAVAIRRGGLRAGV